MTRIDIVEVTDRIRELIDYYTVGNAGEELLVDLDAWNSDDLKEIIGLITLVLRDRGEDDTLDAIYEDTFEDWMERQIDKELGAINIEEAWDEYVSEDD
jgi:hypothetical protein